ncbi:MAG: hypothetical protein ACPLSO_07375 [Fervidicoccaceae archaeon]
MPFTRKIIAADQELAEELLELAKKKNMSLYNLTNKAIESYLILHRARVKEPDEIVLELIIFDTLKSMGFHLSPPKVSPEEAEQIGKVLWELITARSKVSEPDKVLERIATLFAGDTNVFSEFGNGEEMRIIVNLSLVNKEGTEFLYRMFRGIAIAAFGENDRWSIERRDGIIVITYSKMRTEIDGESRLIQRTG